MVFKLEYLFCQLDENKLDKKSQATITLENFINKAYSNSH